MVMQLTGSRAITISGMKTDEFSPWKSSYGGVVKVAQLSLINRTLDLLPCLSLFRRYFFTACKECATSPKCTGDSIRIDFVEFKEQWIRTTFAVTNQHTPCLNKSMASADRRLGIVGRFCI